MSRAIYLRSVLAEVLGKKEKEIPITSYVESNNLYQAVYSTKFMEDKRLRLDIVQLHEGVKMDAYQEGSQCGQADEGDQGGKAAAEGEGTPRGAQ